MGNAVKDSAALPESGPEALPGRRGRRPGLTATAMASATTIVTVLPVFLVGGLAIQLEDDLGMSAALLGAGVATFWAVSALLSTTGGRIAQLLGARNGMLLSVGGGLVSLAGIAFATPQWPWLYAWLALGGVANALGHPPSNGLIVQQVGVRNRAFAFGLKQAAVPAATLIAGISVPVLALTIGWQWTFAIGALFAVLLVPVLLVVTPRRRQATAKAGRGADKRPLPRELKRFLVLTAVAAALGSAQAMRWGHLPSFRPPRLVSMSRQQACCSG